MRLPPTAGGSIWAYHADPPSTSQLQYASRNEGMEDFIPGLNNNARLYTHDMNLLRNMLGAVDLDASGDLSLPEIIDYFASSSTMQKNPVRVAPPIVLRAWLGAGC